MDSYEGQLEGIKALLPLFFSLEVDVFGADGPHPSFSEPSHRASEGVLTVKGLLKWLLSSL